MKREGGKEKQEKERENARVGWLTSEISRSTAGPPAENSTGATPTTKHTTRTDTRPAVH